MAGIRVTSLSVLALKFNRVDLRPLVMFRAAFGIEALIASR